MRWLGAPETIGLLAAGVALLSGAIVYLADGTVVALVSRPGWAQRGAIPFLGPVAGQLPSFAHSFAFAVLSAALLWPWPRLASGACGFWFCVESIFEIAQVDRFGDQIARVLPAGIARLPLLDGAHAYFSAGTFDPLDLVSVALGSGAALVWVRITLRHHEALGIDSVCIERPKTLLAPEDGD